MYGKSIVVVAAVGAAIALAAGMGLAQTAAPPAQAVARQAVVRPRTTIVATPTARIALAQARIRPAAVQLRQSLRARPAQVNLAAVDRARLPVLAVARPVYAANLRVFARDDSFSASTSEAGVAIVIDGAKSTTVAPRTFTLPPLSPASRQRLNLTARPATVQPAARSSLAARSRLLGRTAPPAPAPAEAEIGNVSLQKTDYGIDVSFTRFGALYNVSIECAEPGTDPRCSEDSALTLIGQMEVIGGGGQ